MDDFDETEVIRGSELRENADQAALRFLRGGYSRLVQTTALLTEKSDSMEATLQELQKTLSLISKQLGKHPIAADSSHQPPPVTHSDPYIRDDVNRLPLDNRKSLLRKIEMPKFDGSNAYDWLSKVERFFRVGRYSDFDKLDLVALSLEGDVLKWFNWEMTRNEFHSWDEFRRRLFRRFGAAPEESPGNRLFAIKQKGTISAYVTEFEELSAQVVGLDDDHLEQIFYNGLKTEMKEVLKLKEPIGLENQKTAVLRMETSSFCQLFLEQSSKPCGPQKTFTSNPVTTYTQPRPLLLQNGEGQGAGLAGTLPVVKTPAMQPRQRHTAEELDAMRSKGICFKCKGKYNRGHVCPLKELQILTVVGGIEFEVLDGEYSDFEDVKVDQNPTLCCLSLNSFLGRQSPQAIKLLGWIGKSRLLIMIDSGASHNFITPSVASRLKLKVSMDNNMEVLLGNGNSVQGNGTCRNVQFQLSGVQFQSDFISLELGNVDIILGMQWLETLGTCVVDWKKQEWSFFSDGKLVRFVGDTSLHAPPLLVQPFAVQQLQEQQGVSLAQLSYKDTPKPGEISAVLEDFAPVFAMPTGLPPMREKPEAHIAETSQVEILASIDTNKGYRSTPVAISETSRPGSKIHDVFHVSHLKAVIGDHQQVHSPDPPELLAEDLWIPEAILEVKFDEIGRRELLIQWQNRDESANSWMFSKDFVRLYPAFKLEDKLIFQGGSIDMNHQAYLRKKKKELAVETNDVAETSNSNEDSDANRGFAVSSR